MGKVGSYSNIPSPSGDEEVTVKQGTATRRLLISQIAGLPMLAGGTVTRPNSERFADRLNIMEFIPYGKQAAIRNRANTDDLDSYLATAFEAAGATGAPLVFPRGLYHHGAGLTGQGFGGVYSSPAVNLHFLDNTRLIIIGEEGAELKATAAMTTQLRLYYDAGDSEQAPFGSRVTGLYFNGNSLATTGLWADFLMHFHADRNRFRNQDVGCLVKGFGVYHFADNIAQCTVGLRADDAGDSLISHFDYYMVDGENCVGIDIRPFGGNTTIDSCIFTRESGWTGDLHAIRLSGDETSSTETIRNVRIRGCAFDGTTIGVLAVPKSGQQNILNVTIDDCEVRQTGSYSNIRLADLSGVVNPVLTRNRCNGNTIDESVIVLDDCSGGVISTNSAAEVDEHFVDMTDCTDFLISANILKNIGKVSAATPIIAVKGSGSARINVVNNKVYQEQENETRTTAMTGAIAGAPGTMPDHLSLDLSNTPGLSREVIGTGTEDGLTYLDVKISGTNPAGAAGFVFLLEAATFIAGVDGQSFLESVDWKIAGGDMTSLGQCRLRLYEYTSGGALVTSTSFSIDDPDGTLTRRSNIFTASGGVTTAYVRPGLAVDTEAGAGSVDITLRIARPYLSRVYSQDLVLQSSGASGAVVETPNFLDGI